MMDTIHKEEISEFNGFVFENEFNAEEILTYNYKILDFSESIFKQKQILKNIFLKRILFLTIQNLEIKFYLMVVYS